MAPKSVDFHLVDSHAHLFFDHFKDDLKSVIENAREHSVAAILNVGIDIETSRRVVEMAQNELLFYAGVGVHPNDAHQAPENYIDEVEQLAQNEKVVAIGEIGLDYYWHRCPVEVQKQKFCEQLDLARELNLPVIIHNRDAWQDTLGILESDYKSQVRGVFHCFIGDEQQLKRVLDLGFFVSFTGVVTFKNSNLLNLVANYVPLDKLLLETDSPFMAPVPFRGKRCEPAFVLEIAAKIAEAKKLTIEEIAEVTNENVTRLFGIALGI